MNVPTVVQRGKRRSAETCARISAALRRRKPSAETKVKISAALHRRPCTTETRRKISEANRGKHLSDETRKKIGEAARGRCLSADFRRRLREINTGERNPNFGRERPPETIAKMSESQKLRWQDPVIRERRISAMLKAICKRPTAPELRLKRLLDVRFPGEWRYTGNGQVIIGGCNPDFVNCNGHKAVIEVFGDYWHGLKHTGRTAEEEENRKVRHFAAWGYKCLIVWERETKDAALLLTKKKVEGFVEDRDGKQEMVFV